MTGLRGSWKEKEVLKRPLIMLQFVSPSATRLLRSGHSSRTQLF
jgi:hypothetical protein